VDHIGYVLYIARFSLSTYVALVEIRYGCSQQPLQRVDLQLGDLYLAHNFDLSYWSMSLRV